MNSWRCLLVLAVPLVSLSAADQPVTVTASPAEANAAAHDTVILTLPGAAITPPELPSIPTEPALPLPPPELPQAFKNDSSAYLQRVIGIWKKRDAETLLGAPAGSRPAYDEKKKVNGQIFAWPDPTGHYRELELDFEAGTGSLRTVFAYPNFMTWEDCRKLWGEDVSTTATKDGRNFHSYLNRKLDVLVDSGGKVISLGLY
jgi:hypothetical protein